MTAAVALAAFASCWLALALAAVGAHRLARPLLERFHPRPRAAILWALAALPLAVAALVAVLGFAPWVGGVVVAEHCHPSTGCATHVPVVHAGALYTASLVVAAAAASAALLWSIARRLRRSLRIAGSLRFLAEQSGRQPYELIESRERFAYCIGLLRPHVVLSRGLVECLSQPELEVVLHHEQAHAARRDNLRLWLAGLSLLPCRRRLKQPLLADLALAGEQACDFAAAAKCGRDRTIETLQALGVATPQRPARSRGAFDSPTTLAGRIGALRAERYLDPPALAVPVSIAIVYAAIAVASTDLTHHATEWLLAWFG